MSVPEVIMLVFHPTSTFIIGLLCLGFCIRVFVKYPHICLSKYDVLLVIVAIGGIVAFDGILLMYIGACGALVEPCADLFAITAVSRIMRFLAIAAWFMIGHSAAFRQRREVGKQIQEALDGSSGTDV